MNISVKIIACPVEDQWVAVVTLVKPVTVAAEVAVNKASMKGVKFPDAVANGINKRIVPIIIKPKNMYINIRGEAKSFA